MLIDRAVKFLRQRSFAENRHFVRILVRNALGLPNPMRNPDRDVLERQILPVYAQRADMRSVVFVGCDWYTRHYEKMFAGKRYATLDPDPWKRQFGAREHAVIGMEKLAEQFAPASIDLIVCNGVFGWGLNEPADIERAFDGTFACLREGGHLVLGWNDVPERTPLPLASVDALARFDREPFAPLGSAEFRVPTDNRHTFNFYVKPGAVLG
jgi:SAM-dependent methyltransferase